MVRTPSYDKNGLKRGTWTPEEDMKLIAYVTRYGCWNWRQLPRFAGLARCGKSCRLRWLNYLRPNIKRGNYTQKEEEIIITLHQKLGNKWSVIASHLPGRTDNEIKNHWHTTLKKRFQKNALTHENIKANYSGSDQHMDSVQNNGPLSPQLSSTEFSSTTTAATNENLLMEDNFDFIDANIEAENEISYTPIEKVPDYDNGNSNFQGSDATETFMNDLVMYPQSSSSSESCSVQENDHFVFLEATQSTFGNFWTEPYVADMSHVPNELLSPLVIEPDLEYFSTLYEVDLWSFKSFP